jgi:hypothetical protein
MTNTLTHSINFSNLPTMLVFGKNRFLKNYVNLKFYSIIVKPVWFTFYLR